MTNKLTESAPVTDEELDQMIRKLERDGMTPKMLSLMRELREVRRVNAEKLNQPVSETERTHPNSFTDAELEMMAHGDNPQANAYRELLAFRRNSPGVPGCWIPCSERMPNVGEYVLCLDGLGRHGQFAHDDVYTAAYCDRLQAFTTEYYGDHDWMSKSTPTHWAPIPKMPAAPQQEVKR